MKGNEGGCAEGLGRGGEGNKSHTCRAEYDLYRERNAERKHEIVQQCSRRERSHLEEPLHDGHMTRFESRNSPSVPDYKRG
jgi:hypothetical protein